jgi:catechol 2,3-dioxygenase-like lactoylglutathione lyase family enzyme
VPELICSDYEASLGFYLQRLGFRVLYARGEDRFAFLEREGAELMIEQPHARDRLWPKAELVRPFGRGVNLQIEVSEIGPLHDSVLVAGVPFVLVLEDRWYRQDSNEVGNRQFAIQDPDGYLLRFFQDLGTRPLLGGTDAGYADAGHGPKRKGVA